MDHVFALEISIIEGVQFVFEDYGWFFELVNDYTDPRDVTQFLLPLVSIFDSVFAAQLLLCTAFTGWLVGTLKGWLAEDRPYWWVNETSYYRNCRRPQLMTTRQTCMTGPGNPSSHSAMAAVEIMLFIMWSAHVLNDRKIDTWWWNYVLYFICAVMLVSTMLARIFVAAHFPHQCILGGFIGIITPPYLCRYIFDPTVWGPNPYTPKQTSLLHAGCSLSTGLISLITYLTYRVLNKDPYWAFRKAERWCCNRVHRNRAPFYWSVQNFSSLLGCALAVCPDLAKYRHFTTERSIPLSFIVTTIPMYFFCLSSEMLREANTFDFLYYCVLTLTNILKAILFLRVIPALALTYKVTDIRQALFVYTAAVFRKKGKNA